MKKKILYVVSILISVLISSSATYFYVEYKFNNLDTSKDKVVTEVSITEENTIKSSVSKIYDAVVLVQTYTNNHALGSGTGFVYKTDDNYGYILTNHHVIEDATTIKVTNNANQVVEATLLGSDEYSDIAVLRIDKDAVMEVATIGESTKMELGDTIFTVGSPLGQKYMGTVTKGILSGKDRTVTVDLSSGSARMEVLQTDAAINPGNSGGPLVNANGEVVGIISLKLVQDEIEGMGFAIPIEMAMSEVELLEKGEKIERPVIGVELIDATSTYSLYLYKINLDSNVKSGTVVVKVEDGYPAAKAGLKKGDVIVKIDDTEIEDTSHLRYVLYKYSVGDEIKLKVIRDNKEIDVTLKLEKNA